MDPQAVRSDLTLATMPYTHCKTRVVDLLRFDIPENASEIEYKELYGQISKSRTPAAQALTDAVSSVSLGIAPPVAFPTETVYGLGADATNRTSISGIFAAKGRPSDNPLIVHVASKEHLESLTGEPIPEVYEDLVREYWPGPLTILVPIQASSSVFAPNVHPGQQTIGFRVPSSKYARFFIAATGKPIAAPSANSSGKPSPTTARHVLDDLKGKINFILDGGNCDVGVESTVVDGLHDPPLILRPGGLSQDDLLAHGQRLGNAWSHVGIGYSHGHTGHRDHIANAKSAQIDLTNNTEAPRAPGMKYKHYAPRGRMILFQGPYSESKVRPELDALLGDIVKTLQDGSAAAGQTGESMEQRSNNNNSPDLSIAVLTTTAWSPNASIPVSDCTSDFASRSLTNGTTHAELYAGTSPVDNRDSYSYRGNSHVQNATTDIRIKLHSIPLGTTPRLIAQNLFAALRACDDLGCKFIFAESPAPEVSSTGPSVHEQKYQFDAVLERMRKAASMVV